MHPIQMVRSLIDPQTRRIITLHRTKKIRSGIIAIITIGIVLIFADSCSKSSSERELTTLIKSFFTALDTGKTEQLKELFYNISDEELLLPSTGQERQKIKYQIENIAAGAEKATIVVNIPGEGSVNTLTFKAARLGDSWKLDKNIEVQTTLKEMILSE